VAAVAAAAAVVAGVRFLTCKLFLVSSTSNFLELEEEEEEILAVSIV
jgi:hypothetical protein